MARGFSRSEYMKGKKNSPWVDMKLSKEQAKKGIAKTCGTCQFLFGGICKLTGRPAMDKCDDWALSPKLKGRT